MKLMIYCDGGARGNPGPSASAFAVSKNGKVIAKEKKYLGIRTNNFAEYSAVLLALFWIKKNKIKLKDYEIEFVMDSELVANQMNGVYKVKSEKLKPLFLKAKEMIEQINLEMNFKSVPRSKNKIADSLVNQSIDENS